MHKVVAWLQRVVCLKTSLLLQLALAGSATHAACTVYNSGVAFGTYNPSLGTNVDSTGTITVVADSSGCGSFTIALGRSGTSYSPRVFTTGATTNFAYNLYTNSTRSTIWGDGTAGSQTVTGAAIGSSGVRTFTVYGQIPASQLVAPSAYSAQVAINSTSSSGSITSFSTDNISTTVSAACNISVSSLAFGTYTGTTLASSSTVMVNCTNTTSYNISLSPGTANGPTVTSRKMQSGSNLLNYALFSDAARTLNWGQIIGADTVAGTGSGSAQVLTVYGQIAAGQGIPPGSYADTIIATVIY